MIDFVASEPQYADHLVRVFSALPRRARGDFFIGHADHHVANRLWQLSIEPTRQMPWASSRLTVVASYKDLKLARKADRPVVLCEHGAGQSYGKTRRSASYIGAPDRRGVVAALLPGPHSLARHQEAYPSIPGYAIGCPKLDLHHASPKPRGDRPTIAISFHWDCRVVPETRSAFEHFEPGLLELAHEFDLIGHAHPRCSDELRHEYHRRGIEFVRDFEDVMRRADVYAVDNSSTLFEFASLKRPVVVLNAPFYRRDVDHGMRFWEFADVGEQANEPEELAAAVARALEDPPEAAERRREITGQVYAHTDGQAAQRAAEALLEIAG